MLSGNQGDFNKDLNSKIKNVDSKDSILLLDAAGVSLMYHYACGWQIHTPPSILSDEEDLTTLPKESFSSTQSEQKRKGKRKKSMYLLFFWWLDCLIWKKRLCVEVEDDDAVERKKRTCFVDWSKQKEISYCKFIW